MMRPIVFLSMKMMKKLFFSEQDTNVRAFYSIRYHYKFFFLVSLTHLVPVNNYFILIPKSPLTCSKEPRVLNANIIKTRVLPFFNSKRATLIKLEIGAKIIRPKP